MDEIKHMKEEIKYINVLNYVRSLSFDEKPDYDYIIDMIRAFDTI